MKISFLFISNLILFFSASVLAVNKLTVQDPAIWGTKPGYIDKATLVIEPLGGYVEQSLYLTYSDHNQFGPNSMLEIVHRFELPAGSVITDLWLWIGDSVMQAVMMDTWKARSIYDSIVVVKRDPAFLTKNGNQYELHIYPLTPGSYRRVKITFITPTKWFSNTASAEFPFQLLNSNNAIIKPLEVFFKVNQNVWGEPSLIEIPSAKFEQFVDTLGYDYRYYKIDDVSKLQSLNLTFQTYFTNGYFFDGYKKQNDYTYFQLGISQEKLFNLSRDTLSHKYLIGIDLSGGHNKNFTELIPNLKNALKAALKQNDQFNILIAGNGEIKKLKNDWIRAIPENIDSLLNQFSNSSFADSISKSKLPTIVYCDGDASNGWQFPGINDFAKIQNYPDIITASRFFNQADIIAAYRHGYEDPLSTGSLNSLLVPLDTFFVKGGRLLSYFDFNRDGPERLASHYINGLKTLSVTHGLVKLYRNINGNIGSYFPESLERQSSYFLAYNDSSVKVELMDKDGRPAVISKRINNGLLVVSGMWELNDDGAMKTILDIPLLGLNSPSKYFQLTDLLNEMKNNYKSDSFDKAILFSNSDSLIQKYDAVAWVNSYLSDFTSGRPVFNTINLLDGNNYIPPSLVDGQTEYFGSGYLAKVLSDSTYGMHLETHTNDWIYIDTVLSPNSAPASESFTINAVDTTSTGKLIEMREVNPVKNDPNKPLFFIGSTTSTDSIVFNISAKYLNILEIKSANLSLQISRDTTVRKDVIPSMLGNEKLKDLFANASFDTSQIVDLALKYRLLCDYTALIALEPNDTLHFLQNPNDEGGYITTIKKNDEKADSLALNIYPNPFNNQTTITVNVVLPSEVRLEIYNILGQKVKEFDLTQLSKGKKIYFWDGKNSYNESVSSGIYFARAVIKENFTNNIVIKTCKMIMLK